MDWGAVMKKICAFIAICCSLLLAACGGPSSPGNDASSHADHKPTLDIQWKVEGKTLIVDIATDMHISSEHAGQARKHGEGHIHMYLDNGEKTVLTENRTEFPNLPSGSHTLKISLHNNDHTPYDVTKTIKFDIP